MTGEEQTIYLCEAVAEQRGFKDQRRLQVLTRDQLNMKGGKFVYQGEGCMDAPTPQR